MTSAPNNSLSYQLPENIVFSKDEKQFELQLTRMYMDMARAVNSKDIGVYDTQETIIGQKYFDVGNAQKTLDIYRKVIECGALPNIATTVTVHGIGGLNNDCMITRAYGMARQPAGVGLRPFFIPIPNSGLYQVDLMIDKTNINITSSLNLSAFTYSIVVLEYFLLA